MPIKRIGQLVRRDLADLLQAVSPAVLIRYFDVLSMERMRIEAAAERFRVALKLALVDLAMVHFALGRTIRTTLPEVALADLSALGYTGLWPRPCRERGHPTVRPVR